MPQRPDGMFANEGCGIDIMCQQHAACLAVRPDNRRADFDPIDDDRNGRTGWRKFEPVELRSVDRHVSDRGKFIEA